MTDSILSEILVKSGSAVFYTFSNADGKTWLMPAKNLRVAMNLYQPSGIKGKLMKRFFPYLKEVGLVRHLLGITAGSYKLSGQMEALLRSVFQGDTLEWAVFCGTPSVHRKITMQVSAGKRILGYCKLSAQLEIKTLFRHEEQLLNELHNQGIASVPLCLYCGDLSNNITAFIQNTVKTSRSEILHKWTALHEAFLKELHEKTRQKLPFKETDFYKSLKTLEKNIEHLGAEDIPVVRQAIDTVLLHYGDDEVEFSAYHADFTPWNMFVEKGQLFVFDWEYAGMTCPPYMDWFHYILQIAIIENKYDTNMTYRYYCLQKENKSLDIKYADMICVCYLLYILSFYFQLHNGHFDTNDIGYQRWTGLIRIINANIRT